MFLNVNSFIDIGKFAMENQLHRPSLEGITVAVLTLSMVFKSLCEVRSYSGVIGIVTAFEDIYIISFHVVNLINVS